MDSDNDNHPNDRAIRYARKIATPTPTLSEIAAVWNQRCKPIYAAHIHGHEKAAWRLVYGLGLESVDPPCTGEGSHDSMGCIVPYSPCAGARGSVMLHR